MHRKTHKAVQQYLARYAEPEVQLLANFPDDAFDACVVIPAYQESPAFIGRFLEAFATRSALLIVVINQPEHELDPLPQQKLFEHISERSQQLWQHQHLALWQPIAAHCHGLVDVQCPTNIQCRILTICRYSSRMAIPEKQGVGAARKIGSDVACQLIDDNKIKCSWIGSSDADATLPKGYFDALLSLKNNNSQSLKTTNTERLLYSAATFRFRHDNVKTGTVRLDSNPDTDSLASGDVLAATQLYEQWLHYYVAGLAWAESPYAFYTIGSCLAFDYTCYCQVRGFPKRAAGEDFYLLNKLAKLGPVQPVSEELVLQARTSTRVPFGTGPAVSEILRKQWQDDTYLVYDPRVFAMLKELLAHFRCVFSFVEIDDYAQWLTQLPDCTQAALAATGFADAVVKLLKNNRSEQAFNKQLNAWFDAFRTLKFIHFVEKSHFPPISLAEAKKISSFTF